MEQSSGRIASSICRLSVGNQKTEDPDNELLSKPVASGGLVRSRQASLLGKVYMEPGGCHIQAHPYHTSSVSWSLVFLVGNYVGKRCHFLSSGGHLQ